VAAFAVSAPLVFSGLGLPPGRRGILYVGRLHEQKGVRWLLKAAPHFLGQLPNHDLILAGEGPELRTLESMTRTTGCAERIHFVGWQANVAPLRAAADLLVLPSRWEGMPNVVLEAMAAGKAVVATRSEGVVELLGEQAEPQTAEVNDMGVFTQRIVELAANDSPRNLLGKLNQARAASMFSLPAMIQQYEHLYDSLAVTAGKHGSDSPQNAAVEIGYFFPALEIYSR
jgi:starch synthase (maltosyl-transferring)